MTETHAPAQYSSHEHSLRSKGQSHDPLRTLTMQGGQSNDNM